MANSSHIPVAAPRDVRPDAAAENLRTMPAHTSTEATPHEALPQQGPRKLIRPTLAHHTLRPRQSSRSDAFTLPRTLPTPHASTEHYDSHAEAFYFQKQVQTQTLMAFVLEDGEHIEGYIEWHDRNAIKVRNGHRMLIYKDSIKYLYKVGENHS